MITLAALIQIVQLCTYKIDPSFIKDNCADHMITCLQKGHDLDTCREYWE